MTKTIDSKLPKWENGMPKLELRALKNTLVKVYFVEEYDQLMQVYEAGGWVWRSFNSPTNYKNSLNRDSNIEICNQFRQTDAEEVNRYFSIIGPREFYKIQGIREEEIEEIKVWFEKYKPHRRSKMDGENGDAGNIVEDVAT
jgi:hypothetical protein